MESYNATLASSLTANGTSIHASGTVDGILARTLAGVSAWSIVLTVLAMLVVYDQSMSSNLQITVGDTSLRKQRTDHTSPNSKLHQQERFHRRRPLQDPLRRPLPIISKPKVRGISGKMGFRRIKLRFRLPQVRRHCLDARHGTQSL